VSHSPAQGDYTDWNPTFDIDKTQSRKTRPQVLDRPEADAPLVSHGHFPAPGFGRFVRREGQCIWQGV
jgi:hypothetical protein